MTERPRSSSGQSLFLFRSDLQRVLFSFTAVFRATAQWSGATGMCACECVCEKESVRVSEKESVCAPKPACLGKFKKDVSRGLPSLSPPLSLSCTGFFFPFPSPQSAFKIRIRDARPSNIQILISSQSLGNNKNFLLLFRCAIAILKNRYRCKPRLKSH